MVKLPGTLGQAVQERLQQYDDDRIGPRVWSKDHTIWKPEPDEISNRLGWLDAPTAMLAHVDELRRVASSVNASGYERVMLLGMGGSSLAPEVIQTCFGSDQGMPWLTVLDTTDPVQIRDAEKAASLDRTLFIVASKSGSTIETMTQYEYFRSHFPNASRFVAITDPGSALEERAKDDHFYRTFLNDPEIGGRYSALSYFGMVPAALTGIDVERSLQTAEEMATACGPEASARDNPGAWLGIALGEAALAGRDKLTIVLPEELRSFGAWIEQLIAESTGKEGKGILPIEGEPPGGPDRYGDDRIFVAYGEHEWLEAVEAFGHPVIRYPKFDVSSLNAEFYRWEYATAIACWVLGVNPFDQPNVQEAKDTTARMLAGSEGQTQVQNAAEVLATLEGGDYIAICAFVPRDDDHEAQLQAARERLWELHRVPVTTGYGPRYLHSTGQLHKGGPNTGVFLQVVEDDEFDLAIPGREYSFAQLKRAQADGDLASLAARGRRVARLTLRELAELGASHSS